MMLRVFSGIMLASQSHGWGHWFHCLTITIFMLAATGPPASAEFLTVTTQALGGGTNALVRVDTATQASSLLFSTPGVPDSLIFDRNGNILYTEPGGASGSDLRRFNPTTSADTRIAAVGEPIDLALEPSKQSVLVSDLAAARIDRVDLTTGQVVALAGTQGNRWDGITYDNAGNLFAVENQSYIVKLNPLDGTTLLSSPLLGGGFDGLTFDSFSGNLWTASNGGSLTEVTPGLSVVSTYIGGGSGKGILDGIEGDGTGSLFTASYQRGVYQYNIPSNTFGNLISVPGIDDLAPLSGLGSEPSTAVPEPSSLTLAGLAGLFCLGAWLLRRCAAQRS